MANELKAVLESPYELVVENHIVLFGGRDLTGHAHGKNADGSMGEYFTKSTDLESDYTKSGALHVDFEHGQDPDQIGNDKNSILGFVDWKTARVDDEGVIVRRVLNRRHKYMKWLEPLIRDGLVGSSSESVGGQSVKSADGEIQRWPLRRDSLTVTPMEPRMMSGNTISAIKSMTEDFPELKTLFTTPDTALTDKDDNKNNQSEKMENNIMDELEVKKLVEQGVNEALKAQAEAAKVAADKEAEIKAANESGYKQAVEDLQNRKAPAFNTKTALGFSEEKDAIPAFKHWMQTGAVNGGLISPDSSYTNIKAAFNVADGATGGYLVPDPLYAQIIAKRDIQSWVRIAPTQKFTTPADHILVPTEGTSHTDFVLTAEAAAYDENEGTVGQTDIVLSKYTKLIKASEEFLSYNGTNFDAWLMEALGRAEAGTENAIATTALYASAQASGITTAAAAAITIPELASLVGSLNGGYNVNGQVGFIMRNATEWYLKGVFGTNYYSFDGLFGKPVFQSDDMEAVAATKKAVAFGNFNFFGVAEKPGMMVQRNPYLYMANGQVGIFASIFRGYSVLQAEAFKTLLQHA